MESVMKMHLVIAAAIAALGSHAAFARYDGGDTWSELEANVVTPSAQALDVARTERYDGGDTWSEMEPKASTPSTQSLSVATTANLSSLQQHEHPSMYGTPAEPNSARRTVRVGSGAQSINVAYGDTVRFVAQGQNGAQQSFAWRFDGSPEGNDVDLSQVAPADFPAHDVHVFVAADSTYSGE
jgi:hypothetical protein